MTQSKVLTFHTTSPLEGRVFPFSDPTGRIWEIRDSNNTVIAVSPKSYETGKECREARDAALKHFQNADSFSLPPDGK